MSFVDNTQLIRLLQLSSSALPVGGFTYSQGLEWAVECQWVSNEGDLHAWLLDLIGTNLQYLEVPLLVRMTQACQDKDTLALIRWIDILLAHRETSELRLEEMNRGRAMARLLEDLEMELANDWKIFLSKSQTAGFSLALNQWQIPISLGAQGFAWSWLENILISGVKLIPLGQVAGQRILKNLAKPLAKAVEKGMSITDEEIGSSAPSLAYASAKHETQYTRLFRS
ncbi:urease accessory protein UreF [uncultured Cycloclasticus sp.]|uniref:urease accessory protein UreF n=1 Tax=uncultured Cycloclasticus sp. TaxID=172194 RepID=UPI002590E3F5|nr:urease accessory protein UreF [uncultured Cycloclasticus sp.]